MTRMAGVLALIAVSAHAQPKAEAGCTAGDARACEPNPAAACESGSAAACEELAVDAATKGDTEAARALLARADALRADAPSVLPPPVATGELAPPPLVSADETLEEEAQLPRRRAPLPTPEPTPRAEEAAAAPKATPSYPVGIIAVAGVDIALPVAGTGLSLHPRVGLGMRFALNRRPDSKEKYVPSPAAGFVVGYAGLENSPRFFGEGRVELVVNRPGDLFQPGFTAYAITGFDAHVRDGGAFDPYLGAGIGWDLNLFAKSKDEEIAKPKRSRWGGGWGGGWGSGWGGNWGGGVGVLALLVVPAIIGFICAGRIEVRYHPIGVRGPANVAVLLGLGF